MPLPRRVFLTKGVGRHKEKLTSFEMALRDADIARYNLVRVTSIYPPGCKLIPRHEGVKLLVPGEIVYVVLAESYTNESNRLVAASIGLALPKDQRQYGYLSEHHSYGETERKAGDYAEDLAAGMLATILGASFDPERSWDENKEIWRISGKVYRTHNMTQSAVGSKEGVWTTVLAAAVFADWED
ncbi:MAG: arginine decarboxylase, pyruvoyl-dependent [Nitrospirae bacterium]|nr:arginine decarboxylase, pyruvoyl-dependent [Nitrospirota bacterium]